MREQDLRIGEHKDVKTFVTEEYYIPLLSPSRQKREEAKSRKDRLHAYQEHRFPDLHLSAASWRVLEDLEYLVHSGSELT